MGKEKWTLAAQLAMEELDLPGDLAGAPRLEIIGQRQFLMAGHRGVLAYSPEAVEISGGTMVVRLSGREMEITAMTEREVRLEGWIEKVELLT